MDVDRLVLKGVEFSQYESLNKEVRNIFKALLVHLELAI